MMGVLDPGDFKIRQSLGTLAVAAAFLLMCMKTDARAAEAPIHGVGATFPGPVYSQWAMDYRRAMGVEVRYEALGSGIGIERIKNRRADFGATDYPLSPAELEGARLLQFPAVVGGVVPVVNLSGIAPGRLNLSGRVLGDIYLGKILHWDDPAIAGLNPALRMPRQNITVVHRSDTSGTTYLWSGYLSRSHPQWRERFGARPDLTWPVGIGGAGNEGVASYVQRTRASLGYVEYAYARQHHLSYVAVDDAAGVFILPGRQSFELAVRSAHWDPAKSQYEPGGELQHGAWPITGASYILLPAQQGPFTRAPAVLKFFEWAFAQGASAAAFLDYVPLPGNVTSDLERLWEDGMRSPGGTPR